MLATQEKRIEFSYTFKHTQYNTIHDDKFQSLIMNINFLIMNINLLK